MLRNTQIFNQRVCVTYSWKQHQDNRIKQPQVNGPRARLYVILVSCTFTVKQY